MPAEEGALIDWIGVGKRKGHIREHDGKYHYSGTRFADSAGDPEERVRAAFYVELVERYRYAPENIAFEVETPRREPRDYADIVIYEDSLKTKPYCAIECKPDGISEAEIEQGVKQAGGNANNLGAKYGMLVAGNLRVAFRAEAWDPKRPLDSGVVADLPVQYGKAPKYRYWKEADGVPDLAPVSEAQLTAAFQQCHDVLWEGGRRNPAEAFDEMSKLMFCKLQDERFHTDIGAPYAFQSGTDETVEQVAQRVRAIYSEAQETAPAVFQNPIRAQDTLIYRVVKILQGISLDRMDLDVKGAAFERFLGVVFRGEMGQYFTHRNLVDFVVSMLEPSRRDKVIDPACGSGGFLLQAMDRVRRDAEARLRPDNALDAWKNWAVSRLHGIEINEQISRIAMMGMIIHDDGHTNIKCADALQTFEALNATADGPRVEPGTYTVVMTNPPFGAKVTRVRPGAEHPYLDDYQMGGKLRQRNSQKTEILFLERCLQLLEPGRGRMGVVLPDGILTNSSLQYVRDYLMTEAQLLAVVSLPQHTFMPSGAGVKASIVFLRRFGDDEDRQSQYPIFMAIADHVGYSATGKDDANDLPSIVAAYRDFRGEHSGFFQQTPLCFRVGRDELEGRADPYYYDPSFRRATAVLVAAVPNLSTVGEVCAEIVHPAEFPRRYSRAHEGFAFVRAGNVREGYLDLDNVKYVSKDTLSGYPQSVLRDGDVLVIRTGARAGDVAMFAGTEGPYYASSHTLVLRCRHDINPRYLEQFLLSSFGREQIRRRLTGAAQKQLQKPSVASILIALPPRSVQDYLADAASAGQARKQSLESEAERLLASVDTYLLDQIGGNWGADPPSAGEIARPAVFTVWRREVNRLDPKLYRWQASTVQTEGLRPLGDLVTPRREKVDRSLYSFEALQLVTLHFDGTVEARDIPLWRTEVKGALYFAHPSDLIYSKIDARNGAIAVVPPNLGKVAVTTEYPVYRVKRGTLLPQYLTLVLRCSRFQAMLRALASGHSGRKRIYPDVVEGIHIPVPAKGEQRAIVDEVERRREVAADLVRQAAESLHEAKAEVERAILGELEM